MPNKFFLVEIASGQSTRWNQSDDAFAYTLSILATGGAKVWTEGEEPKVSVRQLTEEDLSTLVFALGMMSHEAQKFSDEGMARLIEQVAPKLGINVQPGAILGR